MIAAILARILGTANVRALKHIKPIVQAINNFEPTIQKLSDQELMAKTNEFREQLSQGKTLDDILPEAFAVVRETSKRALGQRHFDVQLIGGIVLHQGKIAEMKTGEGKTLTATLPLYLNALTGKGAHLVTVNDYLAKRDAEWMSPIYTRLGLTVGVIQNQMPDQARKEVYKCDIVYATNNELGFDYLRDNMKFRLEDYVQRDLAYAIVDEVDSILIDEARTPLIISGSADQSSKLYTDANKVIPRLKKGEDYEIDEKARSVQLTESGNDKVEAAFGIDNLYAIENLMLLHHINQALRAHVLFKRDVDYVVKDDEVLIVDEFIRPALERGAWVISDRFADFTRAYQGAGGHAPPGLVAALETFVLEDVRPDLTLILDLPMETGLERASLRGGAEMRFEAKGRAFHQRLREGFLEIAKAEPNRCAVLDATPAPDAVSDAVWSAVAARLPVGP